MKKFILWGIPFVITMALLGIVLFSGIVMVLWNNILPAVLHVSAITIWQAAGILLLSKILFSGFRGRRHGWHGYGKRRMFMKWHKMSPEEREKMKQFACFHSYYCKTNEQDTMEQPIA